MNKNLIPFILLTGFFSQASYATHAYRSENCVSASHKLEYLGNYPYGGYYGLSSTVGQEQNEEEVILALPLYEQEDADVVFDTANEKIITEQPTIHDCWFDHDEWTSTKDVSILKITEDASKKLGLKQGDVLSFSCEETTDTPNGDHCDDE